MSFLEYIRMAWEAIRSSKLRSLLTLLGIVIGVFSIIVSVTAVRVIEASFGDLISSFGTEAFTIARYPLISFNGNRAEYRNRPNLTYEEALQLRRRVSLPTYVAIFDDFDFTKLVGGGNETDPNVEVYGVDEHWVTSRNYEMAEGRFIVDSDVQFGRPVIVIGSEVATRLFTNASPIGKDVRVRGRRYQVIGVLAEKGDTMGENFDRVAVIPITTAFSVYGSPDRNIFIDVRAPSVQMLDATIDEAIGQFRVVRRVKPGEENNFEINTSEGMLGTITQFTSILAMGGAGIGLIALLAAGIGVMNIMLVSVTERTREIGIRKSLGATRSDVLKQFLLEAVFLCQIGGVLGILLGVLGGNVLSIAFDFTPAFPWDWAIGGVMALTVFALVFGVYPAYKAARLNPIDALRYE